MDDERELLPIWVIQEYVASGGNWDASVATVLRWAIEQGLIPNQYRDMWGRVRPRVADSGEGECKALGPADRPSPDFSPAGEDPVREGQR